jgi:GNAT superfamily N-acetyltransferase
MDWNRGEFTLTDDRARMDFEAVCALLDDSYWAAGRSRETATAAFAHSVCFTLLHGSQVIGFGRAVTDYALFAWMSDVIIAREYRGRGLGKWMMECILQHPALQTRSQWLATLDAHGLYERYGFVRYEGMRRGPEIKLRDEDQ